MAAYMGCDMAVKLSAFRVVHGISAQASLPRTITRHMRQAHGNSYGAAYISCYRAGCCRRQQKSTSAAGSVNI